MLERPNLLGFSFCSIHIMVLSFFSKEETRVRFPHAALRSSSLMVRISDFQSDRSRFESGLECYMTKTVVAVIVENDHGQILVGKRKNTSYSNQLQCPGGNIEENECTVCAAQRELLEETNLQSSNLTLDKTINVTYNDGKTYIVLFYKPKFVYGELKNLEPDKCHDWFYLSKDEILKNNPMEGLRRYLDG